MTPREKNEALWGYAFVAPTMIGLIVLNFYPAINTVYQSFCKTGDFGKGNTFVGLANYTKAFADPEIWQSLINTVKYAIIEVPLGVVIALLLAVFLFGLFNNILHKNIAWISDPKIAWISVGVIGVWSIIGYNMVLFISGLKEIPGDYYEAASIDGATGINQFFNITVPLLSPTTFFIVQTRVIGALTIFDLMFMVMDKTNAALPKVQSTVYVFYKYTFDQGNKGYGAAIVMILVAFIMLVTVVMQRAEKRFVFYN